MRKLDKLLQTSRLQRGRQQVPEKDESDLMAETSDAHLVAECVKGNRLAWEAFVDRVSPLIYTTIVKVLKVHAVETTSETVADLYSSILLRFLDDGCRRLSQFEGRCSLKNWTRVVATHFIIDHLRRLRPVVPLGDELRWTNPMVPPSPSPLDEAERRQHIQMLSQLVSELSARERLVLHLLYVDNKSHDEVAQILETTVGALYARKNRIVRKLTAKAKERGWRP